MYDIYYVSQKIRVYFHDLFIVIISINILSSNVLVEIRIILSLFFT